MRVVVTRPLPEAERTASRLAAAGHDVLVAPMIEIRICDSVLPPADFRALLLTSANAARAAATLLQTNTDAAAAATMRQRPVFAVGARTADAARQAGFVDVRTPPTPGGVDALVGFISQHVMPGSGALLYVSGHDTAGNLDGELARRGYTVQRVVGYAAEPAEHIPSALAESLAKNEIDAVLLYSARSAEAFFSAAAGHIGALASARPRFLCLSDAVAAMVPADIPADRVLVANSPDESALFACMELLPSEKGGTASENDPADAGEGRASGQRGRNG